MEPAYNASVTLDRSATIFFPPMEPLGARFLAAVFRGGGFPTEILPENEETLALGSRHTGGGECVPCPATLGSLLHVMRARELDPARVIFFLPTACGPCRFGQYERLSRIVLDRLGYGGVRILSLSSENTYAGLSGALRRRLWRAIVLADVLRKLGLKLRPRATEPAAVERELEAGVQALEAAFARGANDPLPELERLVARLAALPRRDEARPKIAVVGEIYVRSDPFLNDQLVREIERLGGEALLAPLAEWFYYTAEIARRLAVEQAPWRLGRRLSAYVSRRFYEAIEARYYGATGELLADRREPTIEEVLAAGEPYLNWRFEGEAILTLGRAKLYIEREGVGAIVNASPVFCMPGTITSAIFPRLERETGVPILNLFYDGSGDPNRALGPHLHFLKERLREGGA